MISAIWNGETIAVSDNTIVLENNYYFPVNSVNMKYLEKSNLHTTCPIKGQASYYTININEKLNKNAAWYYANPKPNVIEIKNHIAFWKGVEIIIT